MLIKSLSSLSRERNCYKFNLFADELIVNVYGFKILQKLTLGENMLHISAYLSQKSFKSIFRFETEKEMKTQTIGKAL